jgi:hypothetical protein
MSEPQTFLLQIEEGETQLIFPIGTSVIANRLATLIAGNPKVQTITVHRVISSTRNTRPTPPRPEVTPGLPQEAT